MPYSTNFYNAISSGSGWVEAYTPSSSYVMVLRDVEITNGGADSYLVAIDVSPGTPTTPAIELGDLAVGGHLQWQGRLVVPAGDSLWLYAGGAGVKFTASGYLLSEP